MAVMRQDLAAGDKVFVDHSGQEDRHRRPRDRRRARGGDIRRRASIPVTRSNETKRAATVSTQVLL